MQPTDSPQQVLTIALLEDRPDTLAGVVALLHRRAFRVDSLAFGASERSGIVRLTIAMTASRAEARRLELELERSVYVLAAESLVEVPKVHRELMLVKVVADPHRHSEVLQLAAVFRAVTVDLTPASLSLEVTGSPDKIEALIAMLRPFGILELARTGPLAMARGQDGLGASEHQTSWLKRRETSGSTGVST